MTARLVLLALLPIVAGFALLQRRRLYAIIGMGVFSLLLASVFFLSHAPDVAITEAAIGAALVTFIYVLAIRKTGRLTVAANEVPGLLERAGDEIVGLEWELLDRAATSLGLDLVVRFQPLEDVKVSVLRGEADVAAGGLASPEAERGLFQTPGHLPTARFRVRGPARGNALPETAPLQGDLADVIERVRRGEPVAVELDLARFLALSRYNVGRYQVEKDDEALSYTFLISASRSDLHRCLSNLLADLRTSGELERMIRRYFP